MASDYEIYVNNNPVAVVDQNTWVDQIPQVVMKFQQAPTIYTPLIQWTDRSGAVGAQYSTFTELLDGDVNTDDIAFTAEYLEHPLGVDSRSRSITTKRYGDKVQLHKSSNIFQQWQMSGGRDWSGLLKGVLGNNIVQKFELLARNAYLTGPKAYWTYANGALDFADIDSSHKFSLSIVNDWNLRLGNIGAPIIPGTPASIKMAIVPPGVIYDFFSSLAGSSANEAAMWRDAHLYAGQAMPYEIGMFKNCRFMEVPNNTYGFNNAILYNAGNISVQAAVTALINMGDGAPDPASVKVDETWSVGQKGVTHYIQLKGGTDMTKFALNDWVSIHTEVTADFGIATGCDFRSGRTVVRRIVAIDDSNHRLSFDRPIMANYKTAINRTLAGGAETGIYAIVTKATHVGFVLVLGSAGGILGNVNKPIEFYTPKPIDDFESIWRYVWDIIAGYNIWEPTVFECHFCAVSMAKPGGIIAPPDPAGS